MATIMMKNLEEILVDLLAKRSTKSARNKSAFLAYWPQIKVLLTQDWRLTDICDALRVAGVDFKYSVLWAYVDKQRKHESDIATEVLVDDRADSKPRKRKERRKKNNTELNDIQCVGNKKEPELDQVLVSNPPVFGEKYFKNGKDFKF